jgi:uncharacterized protein YggE
MSIDQPVSSKSSLLQSFRGVNARIWQLLLVLILLVGGLAMISHHASRGTVSVTGSATVTAVPDTASFQVGVNTNGPTPGAALSANNARIALVQNALIGGGVAKKDIQTSNLSVSPTTNNAGVITGYYASDILSVTMPNSSKVGVVIDSAVKAGGTGAQLSGISFTLSHNGAALKMARAQALQNALSIAQSLGTTGKFHVGKIKNLTDNESQNTPTPIMYGSAMSDTMKTSVPIQSGTESVNVQVNVVYYING